MKTISLKQLNAAFRRAPHPRREGEKYELHIERRLDFLNQQYVNSDAKVENDTISHDTVMLTAVSYNTYGSVSLEWEIEL